MSTMYLHDWWSIGGVIVTYCFNGGPGRTRTFDQGIMSPPISLFMCHEAQESQTLSGWHHFTMTETEPIPNPIVGHSERGVGKLKKRDGLWKPKSERPPNRNSDWWHFGVRGGVCGGAVLAGSWGLAVPGTAERVTLWATGEHPCPFRPRELI